MSHAKSNDHHIVTLTGIGKTFGGVRVLGGVDFSVGPGQVHGLVGENGAGKSTLMKILSGVYPVEEGTLLMDGESRSFSSPEDAQRRGIGMVFQEFSLVPTLSVAENVMLHQEPRTVLGLIDERATVSAAQALFAEMDVDIDVRKRMSDFGPAQWQLTEIAKSLAREVRLLILDEPTSSLTRSESVILFDLISRLTARGIGIVYISHRMEEILQVCDHVTVLRDGQLVLSSPAAELTVQDIVVAVVGRASEDHFEWRPRARPVGPVLLQIENVSTAALTEVTVSVRESEVVGLVGLVGSGRSELLRAVFGVDRKDSGTVSISGEMVAINNPRDAVRAGIALIPEDRRVEGLVLQHSVTSNIILTLYGALTRWIFVRNSAARATVAKLAKSVGIRAPSFEVPMFQLSGGNQQKAVIAKWLGTHPRVLLMDEPTAGIDIGAKGEVVEVVRSLAEQGNAILIVSSDLPELLAVSDRVLIMRAGRIEESHERSALVDDAHLQRLIQGAGHA